MRYNEFASYMGYDQLEEDRDLLAEEQVDALLLSQVMSRE